MNEEKLSNVFYYESKFSKFIIESKFKKIGDFCRFYTGGSKIQFSDPEAAS